MLKKNEWLTEGHFYERILSLDQHFKIEKNKKIKKMNTFLM